MFINLLLWSDVIDQLRRGRLISKNVSNVLGVVLSASTDEITASFRRFGHLFVDWPHKAESKSYFPPKGKTFSSFYCDFICCIDTKHYHLTQAMIMWFIMYLLFVGFSLKQCVQYRYFMQVYSLV